MAEKRRGNGADETTAPATREGPCGAPHLPALARAHTHTRSRTRLPDSAPGDPHRRQRWDGEERSGAAGGARTQGRAGLCKSADSAQQIARAWMQCRRRACVEEGDVHFISLSLARCLSLSFAPISLSHSLPLLLSLSPAPVLSLSLSGLQESSVAGCSEEQTQPVNGMETTAEEGSQTNPPSPNTPLSSPSPHPTQLFLLLHPSSMFLSLPSLRVVWGAGVRGASLSGSRCIVREEGVGYTDGEVQTGRHRRGGTDGRGSGGAVRRISSGQAAHFHQTTINK